MPIAPREVAGRARGDALDRVKARPGFEKVAEYLLADVSIAESLDTALLAFSAEQTPLRYVTLNGEVLDAALDELRGAELVAADGVHDVHDLLVRALAGGLALGLGD